MVSDLLVGPANWAKCEGLYTLIPCQVWHLGVAGAAGAVKAAGRDIAGIAGAAGAAGGIAGVECVRVKPRESTKEYRICWL